ncbi:histidine kinase [Clostridium sp. CF012]|uniref:histidine kinase n=1 Tax=Clostridium sp. CF012 TaxID=2843319 RepID=UPI001C0CBDF9|nr:histidine kinase [Clostridium sp. CF012]MBU3146604.1 histidine kinase [Clostridium sp. CF012]
MENQTMRKNKKESFIVSLLTQQDIASRWQVSVQSIETCRKEGIITPVKGVPGIRFSLAEIEAVEGVAPTRFSPLERRKLEREIEGLKQKLATYEDVRTTILNVSSKIINL